MEEQKDMLDLLDMMIQPVFCVKENTIIRANAAAQQLFLCVGDDVRPLLANGAEEYGEFTDGCLYLTLNLSGQSVSACVRRMRGTDVFEVDTDQDRTALRAMSLAAGELRKPMSTVMTSAAALMNSLEDPQEQQQLAQLNRGLYQILRMLGNMSDAEHISSRSHMETKNVPEVLREIFEKARTMLAHAGITVHYQDLPESVYCPVDKDLLERAVLNLLSNAAKYAPDASVIHASLTRRDRSLLLTIQDNGSGIAQEVMGNLFKRYLRNPGIEDSRYGLGLGMRMVREAAMQHGGTLLVTPNGEQGTRIIMTLAIRRGEPNRLKSHVFRVDCTGGFDQALVELSDCLPDDLYGGKF